MQLLSMLKDFMDLWEIFYPIRIRKIRWFLSKFVISYVINRWAIPMGEVPKSIFNFYLIRHGIRASSFLIRPSKSFVFVFRNQISPSSCIPNPNPWIPRLHLLLKSWISFLDFISLTLPRLLLVRKLFRFTTLIWDRLFSVAIYSFS